jgi:hypothetical protein
MLATVSWLMNEKAHALVCAITSQTCVLGDGPLRLMAQCVCLKIQMQTCDMQVERCCMRVVVHSRMQQQMFEIHALQVAYPLVPEPYFWDQVQSPHELDGPEHSPRCIKLAE